MTSLKELSKQVENAYHPALKGCYRFKAGFPSLDELYEEARLVKACLTVAPGYKYRKPVVVYKADVEAILKDRAILLAEKRAKTWCVIYRIKSPTRDTIRYYGSGKEFETAYVRAKCRAVLQNSSWDIPRKLVKT